MENFTLVNKTTICCAKRGSGKSYLCRYLVKLEQKEFDEIFVISATEDFNNFYKTFINEKNIYSVFSSEWLAKFLDNIEKMTKKGDKKKVLLILDDVGSEDEFKKDTTIKKIFIRGRHTGISILIMQQYMYQISSICRSNADWVLCGQMNAASVQILADEYLLGLMSKKEFIQMYHRASSNYNFLLINNNSVKNIENIDEIYGKIKTPSQYL